jgi:hypothetical protein
VPIVSMRVAIPMLAAMAVGCGANFGEVSGKVTYKLHPLASGSVMLLASDGRPYDGAIDAAGNYAIRKVPLGPAKIAVNCPELVAKESGEVKKGESRVAVVDAAKSQILSRIPLRFGDFTESKLVVTIAPGRISHDIELVD